MSYLNMIRQNARTAGHPIKDLSFDGTTLWPIYEEGTTAMEAAAGDAYLSGVDVTPSGLASLEEDWIRFQAKQKIDATEDPVPIAARAMGHFINAANTQTRERCNDLLTLYDGLRTKFNALLAAVNASVGPTGISPEPAHDLDDLVNYDDATVSGIIKAYYVDNA